MAYSDVAMEAAVDPWDDFTPEMTKAERLLRLADRVERSKTFTMAFYAYQGEDFYQGLNRMFIAERYFQKAKSHSCGTAACIAGHVRKSWGDDRTYFPSASAALDLSYVEANELFQPAHEYADYEAGPGEDGHITQAHAAACLRHFAMTTMRDGRGIIDWRGTRPA